MDFREFDRFCARADALQPRVPDWCRAERMEISIPQSRLWHFHNHQPSFRLLLKRLRALLAGRLTAGSRGLPSAAAMPARRTVRPAA